MEAIIFMGLQATGKSSFYKEKFFNSHLRISMDLLNTRNKERQFIEKCFELHQQFVIDNTNPTIADRERYIQALKENNYKVIGYFFQSRIKDSIARNEARTGKDKIPQVGIFATYKKMELPSLKEGFDELYYVQIVDNSFIVSKWAEEAT